MPVDGATARNVPKRKLSDRQRLALAALDECTLAKGRAAPPSLELPAGVRVVESSAWRDELHAYGVLDREATNPRKDFQRVREQLQARKLIGVRGELVWKA